MCSYFRMYLQPSWISSTISTSSAKARRCLVAARVAATSPGPVEASRDQFALSCYRYQVRPPSTMQFGQVISQLICTRRHHVFLCAENSRIVPGHFVHITLLPLSASRLVEHPFQGLHLDVQLVVGFRLPIVFCLGVGRREEGTRPRAHARPVHITRWFQAACTVLKGLGIAPSITVLRHSKDCLSQDHSVKSMSA